MSTIFTRIIEGEIPGTFVHRDDRCAVFMSINPIAPGHALVVPMDEIDHWVDGYVARRFGQVSEFGKIFDPTVDRLLFIVGITAILADGSMPVWFGVAVLAREVLVGGMMLVATLVFHMPRIDVTRWGKTATFLLMFAVPGFLLGNSDFPGADWFLAASWILGIPGLVISWWTGLAYIPQVRRSVAAGRADTESAPSASSSRYG